MVRSKLLVAALLAAGLLVGAIGTPGSAAPEGQGTGTAQAGLGETWSQYVARVEKELKDVGQSIEKLGKQAEAAGGKAKKDADAALKELSAEKKKLDAEARELKQQGEKAWQKTKSGVDSGLEKLKRSVEAARAKLEPKKGEGK